MQKFAAICPGEAWWKYLDDVARGLHLLPVRATGFSPFVLVYKQLPQLPLPMALRAMTEEELAEWGPEHVEGLVSIWEEILAEVV